MSGLARRIRHAAPFGQAFRQHLPALFVIYFGSFGLMLSGLSTPWLQALSLGLLVVAGALGWRRAGWPPVALALAGLAAAQGLAMLITPDPLGGYSQVAVWLAAAAVFWLSYAVDAETLGRALFAVLAAIALVAIYQAINWWLRVDLFSLPPRLGSTLWNPNSLAPVMVVGLALAVKFRRWAWLLAFTVALVLTGSVTSLVVTALGAGVFGALSVRRIRLNKWGVAGALAVLAALTPVVVAQIARRAERGLRYSSLDQRLELWRVALVTFLRRPLAGAGPEGFKAEFLLLGRLKPSLSYSHAHSLYLNIAAEAGVLGLLALGALLVTAAVAIWRGFSTGRQRGAALAAALMVALLAHGLFDYVYWIPAIPVIVLWAGRVLVEADDPPIAQLRSRLEMVEAAARVGQVVLIGLLAFRLTAELDYVHEALARYTTAMSFGLACLLYLTVPRPAARAAPPALTPSTPHTTIKAD